MFVVLFVVPIDLLIGQWLHRKMNLSFEVKFVKYIIESNIKVILTFSSELMYSCSIWTIYIIFACNINRLLVY